VDRHDEESDRRYDGSPFDGRIKGKTMNKLYEIIKRPIISEKSTALTELAGKYVFEVDAKSNKHEIRDAVQQLFKVNVREVRTLMVHGKIKRMAKSTVKRANWKKAIVTLNEGQKIDFFQNPQA
jgi:large subunit ribosomal protein L23